MLLELGLGSPCLMSSCAEFRGCHLNVLTVSKALRKSGSKLIHSFNKYLLSTYYVPGTVLGHGEIIGNQNNTAFADLPANIFPLALY